MTPRRACVEDAAALSLLGGATFLESFANDHSIDEVLAYVGAEHSAGWYAAKLADPAVAVWLIEEAAGCPIAYAMLVPAALPGTTTRDIELKRIYVLSKWHGRGLGGVLYDAVEAEARARRSERLALSVYEHNAPAQAFYRKRGFEEIGRWLFEGFDTSEDLIWVKSLDRAKNDKGGAQSHDRSGTVR